MGRRRSSERIDLQSGWDIHAWGTYVYDQSTGYLALKFTAGNKAAIGADLHREGKAVVEVGGRISEDAYSVDQLMIEGIVLFEGPLEKVCGMALGRSGVAVEE